jgi:hypothetical protein
MEGLCLFYLSKFKEAINVFQSLVESGSGEGDLYFELCGRYMREVAIITVHGPSTAIQESLLTVGTMSEDLNMTPSQALPHGVLQTLNMFLLTGNINLVMTLVDKSLRYLGHPPILHHHCALYVQFCSIILDACEHPHVSKVQLSSLLRSLRRAVDLMWKFCRTYPYALCYALLIQGRYEWIKSNRKEAIAKVSHSCY